MSSLSLSKPRRRLGRWLAGAAAFLFLCFSLQLLFFESDALPALLDATLDGKIRVRYAHAWSIWPGTVHARGLTLSGEDDNVQWILQLDRADFTFSILDCFRHRFHATRVRGEGVYWALKTKQLFLDVTPETLYGLPPIPTMGALALKPYGPPELDTDANYHLVTVLLEDVDARDVREVWINQLHFSGNANITGGFFLKPIRQVKVMAQVEAAPLALAIGADAVVTGLRGHAALTMEPFDPRSDQPLSKLDVAGDLSGLLGDLHFLQRMMPPALSLRAEPGPLRAQIAIEQGKLRPASLFEATTPHLRLDYAPGGEGHGAFSADGAARASLLVAPASEKRPEGTVAAELTGLRLSVNDAGTAPFEAARIRLAVRTRQLDLAQPAAVSGAAADIDDARAPDLRIFDSFLPGGSKLHIEGGRAEAHGHLDSSDEASSGALELALHEARLRGADVRLRLDANATIAMRGAPASNGPIDLSGSHLVIERAQVEGHGGRDWWGRFELPKAAFDPGDKSLALDLRAEAADTRPVRALFAVEGVPAFVATIFTMPDLKISASLRTGPGRFALRGFDAHGGNASIQANYASRGEEKWGEALVKLGAATAGIDLQQGKPKVILIGATSWFEDRVKKEHDDKATPPDKSK